MTKSDAARLPLKSAKGGHIITGGIITPTLCLLN